MERGVVLLIALAILLVTIILGPVHLTIEDHFKSPPAQATLQAVIAEATRVAVEATQTIKTRDLTRDLQLTTEAIQSETTQLQTRTAAVVGTPVTSPSP